jgi:mannose-1-phosphate guanylyltransferase/mannose-6-phosphate isomerase
VLLVLPSDHVIATRTGSAAVLQRPRGPAGKLVTFGIVPTAPETGYGYIKAAPAKACAR